MRLNTIQLPHHLRPWREWYQFEVWRRRRRAHLKKEPLCCYCLEIGIVTPATIADHILSHRGDWNKFLLGELQSLCEQHHNAKSRTEKLGYDIAIGADGYPLDPKHPRYNHQQ